MKKTIYIVHGCLDHGIRKAEAEIDNLGGALVDGSNLDGYWHRSHYKTTTRAARQYANRERKLMIAYLQKKINRLKAMTFEVEE